MQSFITPLRARHQGGFTLIELMVALVVGMVIVLALMTVTTNFERSKRQAQGNAVMGQNVGFVSYDLDRQLRSAGSGFLASAVDLNTYGQNNAPDLTAYRRALGCTLNVAYNGTRILPMQAAPLAPFAAVPLSVSLIPVLVHPGIGPNGDDVIAVMSGASGIGEIPVGVRPNGAAAGAIDLASSVGIKANDMLMVIETGQACMMTQVASSYVSSAGGTSVSLGGTYYADSIGTQSLSNYGKGTDASGGRISLTDYPAGSVSSVLLFGNSANNMPQMNLYGVDADHVLRGLDLLAVAPGGGRPPSFPVAENVMALRVMYGLDPDVNGSTDTWVRPGSAGFAVSDLTDHTTALTQSRLLQIRAIRVSMLVYSDRVEKDDIAASSYRLFADLPGYIDIAIPSGIDRKRHYKIVDFTVPLRNARQLPIIDALHNLTPATQIAP